MKPIRIPPRNPAAAAPTTSGPTALEPGKTIDCTVTSVRGGEVQVSFEGGEGAIAASEFSSAPPVGSKLQAWVWCQERDEPPYLSVRKAATSVDWSQLKPGDLLEGTVVEVNKGGVRLDIGGVRGFLPSSQLESGINAAALLRRPLRAEVQEWRGHKEVVLTRRRALDERRQRRQQERYARFQRGETLEGTVVRVNEHGAFIDLGGVDGLLHVSKIERQQRESSEPSLGIEPGARLQVTVLNVDPDRGRIGLGFPRDSSGVATARISEEYQVGEQVMGLVKHVDGQGAQVMIDEGVMGYVPARCYATWEEPPRRGNVLRATVSAVDPRTHRIELAPVISGEQEPASEH